MKKQMIGVVAALALLCAGQAMAQDEGMGLGVGAKVGTMGLGIELTKGFTDTLNGRVGFNAYNYSRSENLSDIDYDMDLKFQSFAGFLDWHPGGGNFRMSVGYFINNNELDMTAQLASGATYKIGDQNYTANQLGSLKGNVNLSNGAYLGLGWGNAASKKKGWSFIADAGVVAQGSPDVSLTSSGGTLSNNATLLAEIQKEEDNMQGDLDHFKYYPVVSLGASYSF